VPLTLTCVEALPLPFGPVQVREKLLFALIGPLDWLPEVALVPDHAPAAEHEVAFVELHVSVETPPFATDVGFAPRDTEAAAGDSSLAPPHAASTSPAITSRPLAFKIAPNSLTNATKNVHQLSVWRRLHRQVVAGRHGNTVAAEVFRYAGGTRIEPSY
jgi:hypothetical protein